MKLLPSILLASIFIVSSCESGTACDTVNIPALKSLHTRAAFEKVEALQAKAAAISLHCSISQRSQSERYRYMAIASWSYFNAARVAHRLRRSADANDYLNLAAALYRTLTYPGTRLPTDVQDNLNALQSLLRDAQKGRWPIL